MRLDRDEVLQALPDLPSYLEARGLLREGLGEIEGLDVHHFVISEPSLRLVIAVGRPPDRCIQRALERCEGQPVILTESDHAAQLSGWLPGWVVRRAQRFVRHEPMATPNAPIARVLPMASLAPELGRFRMIDGDPRSGPVATAWADGVLASVCAIGWETESYCDLMVETRTDFRRQGYATAAVAAMVNRVAAEGRRSLWFAESDHEASIRLAARLGFRPVSSLTTIRPS